MQCFFTATLTTLIHNNLSERLAALLYPGGAPSGQSVSHFVIMTQTMTALHLWKFILHTTFYNIVASSQIWLGLDAYFPVWKHNLEHAICLQVLSSLINFSLVFLCY
jgi:hypothetical protein